METMTSIRFKLNTTEVTSFLKGLAISISGAALLYIGTALSNAHVPDKYVWALVAAQNAVNFLRLWAQGKANVAKKAKKA